MRSVFKLLVAALIGAGLLMPPVVRAQNAAVAAQQTPPGWIFTPSIVVGGTWDDNVLLTNPEANPPGDYGSPITPAARLSYTGKYTRFSSGYSGSFVRYLTLTELNSLQQSFNATIDRKANGRLTFFGRWTCEKGRSSPTLARVPATLRSNFLPPSARPVKF